MKKSSLASPACVEAEGVPSTSSNRRRGVGEGRGRGEERRGGMLRRQVKSRVIMPGFKAAGEAGAASERSPAKVRLCR